MVLAVAVMLAIPEAFVVEVVDESAALAPVAGAANVTVTPLTGLLPASRTVTCNGVAKAAVIAADCGVPPVAAMAAGGPVELVSANVAGVTTPATLAVTL